MTQNLFSFYEIAAGKNGGGGGSGASKKAVPSKTGDKNVKLQFRFSKESGWKSQSKPTHKGLDSIKYTKLP